MSDGSVLLAAIRAEPGEDTPRLAYADWLDEHGVTESDRARAAFIRLQVERARIGERRRAPLAARASQLDAGAAGLLHRFRDDWLRDLPPAALRAWIGADEFLFRRGFLFLVLLNADDVPAGTPGPWDREPVAEVLLDGTAEAIGRAVTRRWMSGVSGLGNRVGIGDTGWDELAELVADAPCGPRLRTLRLEHRGLSDAALRALARSTVLPGLRSLRLAGDFTAAGWAALVDSPLAGRLESLSLGAWAPVGTEPDRRRVGSDGAAALAWAPRLANLRHLSLIADRLGPDGLRSLLASESLAGLRHLSLNGDSLDTRGRGPFGPTLLPELDRLDLVNCGVTVRTVRTLAATGLLTRLRHINLNVNGNGLTADAVRALLDGPGGAYPAEVLELGHTAVGDEGVVALARSDRFPHLVRLNLTQTGVTEAGAEALLGAPWADQLDRLDLGHNALPEVMRNRLFARFGDTVVLDPPEPLRPPLSPPPRRV